MKRNANPKSVVAALTVALAGLIAVQLVLLKIAYDLKDQAFGRNAVTALAATSQDLETGEIAWRTLDVIDHATGSVSRQRPQVLRYEFQDSEVFIPKITAGTQRDSLAIDIPARWPLVSPPVGGDSLAAARQMTVLLSEDRTQLIQKIVGRLVDPNPLPISERLDPVRLDSVLQRNLQRVGIDLVPNFAVVAAAGDSSVIWGPGPLSVAEKAELSVSGLRACLFPLDPNPGVYELVAHFPGRRGLLFRQIGPLLAASLLFIAVIIGAFTRTLGTIARLDRLTGHLVDFINNLTHEFKTPLATVALASEALARPEVAARPDTLRRYNRMIGEENRRLHLLVDKILQLARLEQGDFQLNRARVDLHELITETAAAFALQVENRRGTLTLDLGARSPHVDGDPLHLGNILANLIDNALKYSPEAPQVKISTRNVRGDIVVEVSDRGAGIPRVDQERVFAKYYRGQTGNVHDVKGSGLGLSFTKLLTEAHGGSVHLTSEPGHGTRVTLRFPASLVNPAGGQDE